MIKDKTDKALNTYFVYSRLWINVSMIPLLTTWAPAKALLVKRDPLPCRERSQVHEEPQAGDEGCAVFWVRRTADT